MYKQINYNGVRQTYIIIAFVHIIHFYVVGCVHTHVSLLLDPLQTFFCFLIGGVQTETQY